MYGFYPRQDFCFMKPEVLVRFAQKGQEGSFALQLPQAGTLAYSAPRKNRLLSGSNLWSILARS